MSEKKQDWYFTFGSGQQYEGRYVKVYGTYRSARERMVEMYGIRWSFQYPSAEDAGVERWGYRRLK